MPDHIRLLGDEVEAAKWVGYARGRGNGSLTSPVPGVTVRANKVGSMNLLTVSAISPLEGGLYVITEDPINYITTIREFSFGLKEKIKKEKTLNARYSFSLAVWGKDKYGLSFWADSPIYVYKNWHPLFEAPIKYDLYAGLTTEGIWLTSLDVPCPIGLFSFSGALLREFLLPVTSYGGGVARINEKYILYGRSLAPGGISNYRYSLYDHYGGFVADLVTFAGGIVSYQGGLSANRAVCMGDPTLTLDSNGAIILDTIVVETYDLNTFKKRGSFTVLNGGVPYTPKYAIGRFFDISVSNQYIVFLTAGAAAVPAYLLSLFFKVDPLDATKDIIKIHGKSVLVGNLPYNGLIGLTLDYKPVMMEL